MIRSPILAYVVSAVMGVLAIQGYGAAVDASDAALRLSLLLVLGTGFSLIVRLIGKRSAWLSVGPWLGLVLATMGCAMAQSLTGLLPGGVQFNQIPTGPAILWLLVMRAPALWTDSDLVFQAVPGVALFGLAGTSAQDDAVLLTLFILHLGCAAYLMAWLNLRGILASGNGRRASALEASSLAAGQTYALVSVGIAIAAGFLVAPVVRAGIHQLEPLILAVGPRAPRPSPEFRVSSFEALDLVGGSHTSSNAVILRVTTDRPLYLRERAFGEFTGTSWLSVGAGLSGRGRAYRLEGPSADLSDYLTPEVQARTEAVTQEIVVVSGLHPWILAASEPRELAIWGDAGAARSELRYVPEVGLLSGSGLGEGSRYEVISLVPPRRLSELRRARAASDSGVYTQLPRTRSPRLGEAAARETEGQDTDYDKVETLRSYVARTCRYSLAAPPLQSRADRASEFLFDVKVGYCDSYATALCVLCRELGMDSRIVRGFAPGDFEPRSGTYLVRDKHYHVWTEVRFVGIGWVAFDATEGTTELDPQDVAVAGTESGSLLRSRVLAVAIDCAIVLAVLYLIFLVVRQRVRLAPAIRPRGQVGLLYRDFVASLQRAGYSGRRPYDTPLEHLAIVLPALPQSLGAAATEFVERVNNALFGPEVTVEVVDSLRRMMAEWAQSLRDLARRRR
jgi:transglutaminase-like putative cysteine protease